MFSDRQLASDTVTDKRLVKKVDLQAGKRERLLWWTEHCVSRRQQGRKYVQVPFQCGLVLETLLLLIYVK